jgi:hypothetical protein
MSKKMLIDHPQRTIRGMSILISINNDSMGSARRIDPKPERP